MTYYILVFFLSENLEENREFTIIADPSELQPRTAIESSGPQPSTSSSMPVSSALATGMVMSFLLALVCDSPQSIVDRISGHR